MAPSCGSSPDVSLVQHFPKFFSGEPLFFFKRLTIATHLTTGLRIVTIITDFFAFPFYDLKGINEQYQREVDKSRLCLMYELVGSLSVLIIRILNTFINNQTNDVHLGRVNRL